MADVLKDDDDDIEVIEVEELPKPGETPAAKEDDDDEDDSPADDDEDARLAGQDDEDEDAVAGEDSAAKKKRVKRRQIQKQARDRTLQELNDLKAWKALVEPRLAAMEGNTLNANEAHVDTRLAEVRRSIEETTQIIAKAIEAGNGDDATLAMQLRDEAKAAESELLRSKGTFADARRPKPTTADPVVVGFSNQWKTANSGWYGQDPDATAAANKLDAQIAAEGYNPKTDAYWKELTRRMNRHFGNDEAPAKADPAPKKRPPPQGQQREHAPASTRKEVYVTPERKKAMMDAGIWDDPTRRTRMLKAYAEFDRDQSAN